MSSTPWSTTLPWTNTGYPAVLSTSPTSQMPEQHQTLSQLHHSKGSPSLHYQQQQQQQAPVMVSKFMSDEGSIPMGILHSMVFNNNNNNNNTQHYCPQQQQQQQQQPFRQYSPQVSYGPHTPVEGSDPEGYQGSNTVSDAYSDRRLSGQEHFAVSSSQGIFQNVYQQDVPAWVRQPSPSTSDASTYFTSNADGACAAASGVPDNIDPSLLKTEDEQVDVSFPAEESVFDSAQIFQGYQRHYDSPEPEDANSLNNFDENVHVDIKDHGLYYYGAPARTLTNASMATTVIPSSSSVDNECNERTTTLLPAIKKRGSNTSASPKRRSKAPTSSPAGSGNKHRRKSSSMSSGSESGYSDNNSGEYGNSGKYSSKASKVNKKKPKSTCRECHKKFPNQSELRRHTETSHSKPYRCVFADDNNPCRMTFGARNEWKRHITSMHLRRELYRCREPRCRGKPAFNRRDLFQKHVGRMHEQPGCLKKGHPEYETSRMIVGDIADKSKITRDGPGRCFCGFCNEMFEGVECLGKMLDHAATHFANGDEASRGEWRVDPVLTAWIADEGGVVCGRRGEYCTDTIMFKGEGADADGEDVDM